MATRWTPDTCGCSIIIDGNNGHPEKKCPYHIDISDSDIFSILKTENRKKNVAISRILEIYGDFIEFENLSFRFDSDRNLFIKTNNSNDDKISSLSLDYGFNVG